MIGQQGQHPNGKKPLVGGHDHGRQVT